MSYLTVCDTRCEKRWCNTFVKWEIRTNRQIIRQNSTNSIDYLTWSYESRLFRKVN